MFLHRQLSLWWMGKYLLKRKVYKKRIDSCREEPMLPMKGYRWTRSRAVRKTIGNVKFLHYRYQKILSIIPGKSLFNIWPAWGGHNERKIAGYIDILLNPREVPVYGKGRTHTRVLIAFILKSRVLFLPAFHLTHL